MMATHTYRPHTPASAVLSIADVLADVCPGLESTPHFLERFIGDIFPAPLSHRIIALFNYPKSARPDV